MMVHKRITHLAHAAMFNEDRGEWRCQATDLNIWANYKTFLHQYHRKQRRVVTIAGKEVYNVTVQNIHGVPSPLWEEHHTE